MSKPKNQPARASRSPQRFATPTRVAALALLLSACAVGEPDRAPAEPPTPAAGVDGLNPMLRIVQFRPTAMPPTIRHRELWSEIRPWTDRRTGMTSWVLGASEELEASLRAEGAIVRPFERPSEYDEWDDETQTAFNIVAKYCGLNPASSPPLLAERATAVYPELDAKYSPVGANPPYSSYYLPYLEPRSPSCRAETVPRIGSFAERVWRWGDLASTTGYAGGKKVPRAILGGWPLDPAAKRYKDRAGTDLVYIDIGWPSPSGPNDGIRHEGPRSVVYIVANQHPREMVVFETAWRLAQRIVASYAIGTDDGEWGRSSFFWRSLIDAGVHVIIVPSANPSAVHEQISERWPCNPFDASAPDKKPWLRTNAPAWT